jgi:hypothetical protein
LTAPSDRFSAAAISRMLFFLDESQLDYLPLQVWQPFDELEDHGAPFDVFRVERIDRRW